MLRVVVGGFCFNIGKEYMMLRDERELFMEVLLLFNSEMKEMCLRVDGELGSEEAFGVMLVTKIPFSIRRGDSFMF